MKNRILKSVAILVILIMALMICSISFASSVTAANIKDSIEKFYKQNIYIMSSDRETTTGMNDLWKDTVILNDSQIGARVEGVDYILYNYSVAENYCTFDINVEDLYKIMGVDISNLSKEQLAGETRLILAGILMDMTGPYMATADAVEKDLSLAWTYFEQKLENIDFSNVNNIDINVNNDIFSLIIKSNDMNVLEKATLKINLDKLANLDETKIDKNKITYKVCLGQIPDLEKVNLASVYKIGAIDNQTYTGKKIKPAFDMISSNAKEEVKSFLEDWDTEYDDYTVSYSNNLNTGKATVTVTGKGWYKGKLSKTFYIIPSKVKGLTVKKQAKTSVTLNWTKNGGNVTGYKVYYYDYNKKDWVYSGKTKGTSYKVEGLKAGTTYKFKIRAYKNIDGKQYFGAYSSSVKTSTKTKAPTLLKATAGKKKATINIKKVSKADGYQIQYSADKNFKKNNKTTSTTKASKTISKLTSKKKYHFRVRAYRIVDGKKVYSSYSEVKSIKIK